MHPVFLLQIVDHEGRVAKIPAGGHLEINLVDTLTKHITTGVMTEIQSRLVTKPTEAQITKAISDGVTKAIYALKLQSKGAL